ncbi:YceI family protein [Kineococcus gynurae]|uniref:YceI family protein n=1 Tax=Kineococcus gynurae TaxID=452979 RepID=A0ABV5LW20_9ACTN
MSPTPTTGTTGTSRATGRIRTRDDWPVPGAAVTLLSVEGRQLARATTGADGGFDLGAVPAGPATLLLSAAGHEPSASAVDVPASGGWALGDLRLRRQDESGVAPDLPEPGVWVLDAAHSSVTATAHHLGLAAVHGRFSDLAGVITVADEITASRVEVSIAAASIDTGHADRDAHLRSADFLDVEHHPRLTFVASGVRRGPEGWVLDGELTLLGVTRPVALALSCTGVGPDPWGGRRAAFTARTELHRDQFRMNWNQAVAVGVAMVGTTLKVAIDVEAVRQA